MSLFTRFLLLCCVQILLITTGCHGGDSSPNSTYAVSGKVEGAGGATVTATGPISKSATADATGTYSIAGLPNGQYTLNPIQVGLDFAPDSVSVTVSGADAVAPTINAKKTPDSLSADDLAYIDSLPEAALSDQEIILPNGMSLADYTSQRGITVDAGQTTSATQSVAKAATSSMPAAAGPQQKKADLIAKMLVEAADDYACARKVPPCTKWDYEADKTDPVLMPKQTGLTYVYGGSTPLDRTKPKDKCTQLTHGMDCSGLILNIAAKAGLSAPTGDDTNRRSAAQSDPDQWNEKIPPEWQLKMKLVTDGTLESGDIVAWSDHIGIAASKGTIDSAIVISSTGGKNACETNIKPPRGPRALKISDFNKKKGKPTAVLRLVTTLTGDWSAYIRCTAQTTDASTIDFSINNDQGGPFKANGTGIDYNGAPLSFILSGNYDQLSNLLTATLAFTDGTRSDSFSQKLLQDDTGYFPLTKVIDNGGCPASTRLVRKTTVAPTDKSMQQAPSVRDLQPTQLFGGSRSR